MPSCGTTPALQIAASSPEFDALRWDEAPELLAAWKEGRTGYPIVDAAMRQLVQAGWMHNRLRMITASFLTKDLGSTGAWASAGSPRSSTTSTSPPTTAAGSGRPRPAAMPSPGSASSTRSTQSEKFDAEGRFIRRYVPELARCRRSSSTPPGPWTRPGRPPAGSSSVATTRHQWSTMRWPAIARWHATRPCSKPDRAPVSAGKPLLSRGACDARGLAGAAAGRCGLRQVRSRRSTNTNGANGAERVQSTYYIGHRRRYIFPRRRNGGQTRPLS
jgi:hypothetical protein